EAQICKVVEHRRRVRGAAVLKIRPGMGACKVDGLPTGRCQIAGVRARDLEGPHWRLRRGRSCGKQGAKDDEGQARRETPVATFRFITEFVRDGTTERALAPRRFLARLRIGEGNGPEMLVGSFAFHHRCRSVGVVADLYQEREATRA